MITKKDFLKKAEDCFISKEKYTKMVNIALDSGLINLENCAPNYSAVYPLAVAIYEKETKWYITGSSDDTWRRKARRQANEIFQMFYNPAMFIRDFYKKYKCFS